MSEGLFALAGGSPASERIRLETLHVRSSMDHKCEAAPTVTCYRLMNGWSVGGVTILPGAGKTVLAKLKL